MTSSRSNRAGIIITISLVVIGLLIVGCSFDIGLGRKATVVVSPFEGAPVTASVDGKTLVVTNNVSKRIYHRVFPTDILPAIEWAPCIAPETCPADQGIDPGDEKRIKVSDIKREETESITVYWWHYLEKAPGASVPPMEFDEIVVFLP
ncbi:MAG: hypothetical protein BMS9Abin02_1189 [Anaerolineae bacterium]|nr:MAG: hypothetical protein BMS9Abin02_1189 [Anaerolineae bacterium]